jgi:hypothetical protein
VVTVRAINKATLRALKQHPRPAPSDSYAFVHVEYNGSSDRH